MYNNRLPARGRQKRGASREACYTEALQGEVNESAAAAIQHLGTYLAACIEDMQQRGTTASTPVLQQQAQ